MNGKNVQATQRSSWWALADLLGCFRFACVGQPKCELSARLPRPLAAERQHQQWRLVAAAWVGAAPRHQQLFDASESATGTGSCGPDCRHPPRWLRKGRPAVADPISIYRYRGLRQPGEAHRSIEADERLEDPDHPQPMSRSNTVRGGDRCCGGNQAKDKKPASEIGAHHFESRSGQLVNHFENRSLDFPICSKFEACITIRNGREPNARAGFVVKAPILGLHDQTSIFEALSTYCHPCEGKEDRVEPPTRLSERRRGCHPTEGEEAAGGF